MYLRLDRGYVGFVPGGGVSRGLRVKVTRSSGVAEPGIHAQTRLVQGSSESCSRRRPSCRLDFAVMFVVLPLVVAGRSALRIVARSETVMPEAQGPSRRRLASLSRQPVAVSASRVSEGVEGAQGSGSER